MTGLLLALSGFILSPTIENVEISPKEKAVIMSMITTSKTLDKCSITGPVGIKKGTIVLGLTCADSEGVYIGRLGIDYVNKYRMRKRFIPSQWK